MVWEPSLWCLSLRGDFFPQITLSGNTLLPHLKLCFHGDPKSLQVYREINCYVLGGLSPQPSEHLEFSSLWDAWNTYLVPAHSLCCCAKTRTFLVITRSLYRYGKKYPRQPFHTLTGFNHVLRKRNTFAPLWVLCRLARSLWVHMCINLVVSWRVCFPGVVHHLRLQ